MAQNIYTSESPPILVPRDVSYSQFLMKYNPDSVPADKVIFEELDNPSKNSLMEVSENWLLLGLLV
jgi:hypothetical protein